MLEQPEREAEVGPVVAQLHDLEAVALEVDIAIEVLFVESLHGDLLAMVGLAVFALVELEVCLDGLAGELGLLVLAGSVFGSHDPEGGEDGQVDNQREEDPRLESAAELPGDVARDTHKGRDQGCVGEVVAAIAVSRQRGVGDGRVLCSRIVSHAEPRGGAQWHAGHP